MVNDSFNLEGKVALVTGGNGGIGLAMASALAQAGADVCIWGRDADKNRRAVKQLQQSGRRVLALECDISERSQVDQCFSDTVAALGKVTTCFANAGISPRSTPFHQMDSEEWRSVFRVNMEGTFLTFRAAISHMLEAQVAGSLVAISSLAALFGQPRGEHYAATKAGLVGMVRGLAVEYARHNIRANAILPGFIHTDMIAEDIATEKAEAAVLRRIPVRRWGLPEDFGAIAVYFASDASRYHTGDSVTIDGGYVRF